MSDSTLTVGQQTGRRAVSILTGEGVGIAVALGSVMLANKVAGKQLDAVKEWTANSVILPILGKVEAVRTRLGRDKVESPHWKEQMSPIDRARKYADSLIDLSIMWPIGIAVRLGMQSKMDEAMGVPIADKRAYAFSKTVDTGVGLVAMLGMNTVGKRPTKAMSDTLGEVLSKAGLPKNTANNVAKYMVYLQAPNVVGLSANIATLHHLTHKTGDKSPAPSR